VQAQALPLTGLPRIDAHAVEVAAAPERVWAALLAERPRGSSLRTLGAALLGCRERRTRGPLDRAGSTLAGFRVAHAQPSSELALAGEHRFARYALTFEIEPSGEPGRSLLRATTDAAFPGPHGRAYGALVVGTGMHVRLLGGTLARVKRSAERGATT
jgi:hypothetical protein